MKSNGYELATPFHIELARKKYNFDTRGHYVDLGVVWRSTENPNSYHAKQLEPQINYALGKTPEHSVVILSSMLNLTNDKNAPYDVIIVTSAAPDVPDSLVQQLKKSGCLLIPVGDLSLYQQLFRIKKKNDGSILRENLGGVAFVPMRGQYGWK